PSEAGGCRVVAWPHIVVAGLEQPVHIRSKLVSRTHLPGETEQHAVDRLFIDGLPARNRAAKAVCIGVSLRDPECVSNRSFHCEKAGRTEVPQSVFLDRPLQSPVEITVRADSVNAANPPRCKEGRQIVTLQAAALESGKE